MGDLGNLVNEEAIARGWAAAPSEKNGHTKQTYRQLKKFGYYF
jgi:hypothetical protein